MDLEPAIIEELRKALERRGLTQKDAAVTLETSVKHLNAVLRGRAHPSLASLMVWSIRLGVTWQVQAQDLISQIT